MLEHLLPWGPTVEIVIVSVVLVATIALLVSEVVPYEVTASGIMVALMVSGVLEPERALAGFSNPAPLTVGALFIVSAGVMRTGAIEIFGEWISRLSKGKRRRFLLLLLASVGVLSAFVNNTPVVLLFIPVVIKVSSVHGLVPSRYLMPVSFVSILGGTCTLVGTSTNVIVSDVATDLGYASLGMFELTAVGVPIALVGGLYLFFVAPRLLPAHRSRARVSPDGETGRPSYLSEWRVGPGCELIGEQVGPEQLDLGPDVALMEVLRTDGTIVDPEQRQVVLEAGDILIVRAEPQGLMSLPGSYQLEPVLANSGPVARRRSLRPVHNDVLVEILVPPGSRHVGNPVSQLLGAIEAPARVLGIKRKERHYRDRALEPLRLEPGDTLLAHCSSDCHENLRDDGNLVVVDDVTRLVHNRNRAPVALAILAAMILSVSFGLTSMVVASMTAALAMIVAGCVRLRVALRAIDARVLLLIIGTIALGSAMQQSGAADLYARAVLALFRGAGPHVLLGGIVIFTSLMSTFVSNNSTAVLVLPLAVSLATSLGVDARAFIVATALGASAAFASPVGYQTNLLVYGPGGYRFTDFLRVGLPLNAIVAGVATGLIPWIWPI